MTTAACPLDDDRGTFKTISLQFVCPVALCVRSMIILCLMDLRREEQISRAAYDCHTPRGRLVYLSASLSLSLCSDLYKRCELGVFAHLL